MIMFKGESTEPYKLYNSRKEIIYEYYEKLILECKEQIREINRIIKNNRQNGLDENSSEMRKLKNSKTKLRKKLNKYYDFLWMHVSCLDQKEAYEVEQDLFDRHIVEDYYVRYV